MRWTWDPEKDRINRRKHRVSFETAIRVFEDRNMWSEPDPYPYEDRWRTIGVTSGALIIVVHTWPDDEQQPGRIISARIAARREISIYEEGYGQAD